MKDIYYGDKRDIVKWSGILLLCKETGINYVLQIAYFRKQEKLRMHFGSDKTNIPDDVIRHFRDVDDIKRLGTKTGVHIEVFKQEFQQSSRDTYHIEVCDYINKWPERKVVFLDPDTGLAVKNAKAEHIKPGEVLKVWQSLQLGDFLAFYQHSFRDSEWVNIRKKQLAEACKIKDSKIKQWIAPEITKDAVFFFCEK